MTTITPFVPNNRVPFAFQPTLDGQVYNVTVTWNLFGVRYYINVYSLAGVLVVAKAMVGSPDGLAIEGLSWANGKAFATTSLPHGFKIGTTIALTVTGCAPDAFNGQIQAFVTGPQTLTWAIAGDPGMATAFGAVTYNISLVAGYFASTLVFRQSSQQFEVSP